MKKELLAPAGDTEAGYAALYYGADAVYLGLKHFSARATAANFGADDLNEFVGYRWGERFMLRSIRCFRRTSCRNC